MVELKKLVKSEEYILLEHIIKPKTLDKIVKLVEKVIKEEKQPTPEQVSAEQFEPSLLKPLSASTFDTPSIFGPVTEPLVFQKITRKRKKKAQPKKKSQAKKTKGTVKADCMNNTLSDIKKSVEYKSLAKSVGKTKLKKKQLCNAITDL